MGWDAWKHGSVYRKVEQGRGPGGVFSIATVDVYRIIGCLGSGQVLTGGLCVIHKVCHLG